MQRRCHVLFGNVMRKMFLRIQLAFVFLSLNACGVYIPSVKLDGSSDPALPEDETTLAGETSESGTPNPVEREYDGITGEHKLPPLVSGRILACVDENCQELLVDYSGTLFYIDSGLRVKKTLRTRRSSDSGARVNKIDVRGKNVLLTTKNKWIFYWNLETGTKNYLSEESSIYDVAIENNTAVLGLGDGKILVWNVETGEKKRLEGHTDHVTSVAISETTIVSGSSDKTIRVWDSTSGIQKYVLKVEESIDAIDAQGMVAVVGSSGFVRVLDLLTGQQKQIFKLTKEGVAFTPVVSGNDETSTVEFKPKAVTYGCGPIYLVLKNNTAVVSTHSCGVRTLDIETGEQKYQLVGEEIAGIPVEGKQRPLTVALDIKDKNIILRNIDDTVEIWNPYENEIKKIEIPVGHQGYLAVLQSIAIHENYLLSTGGLEKMVRVWKVDSGSQLRTLEGHTDVVIPVVVNGSTGVSGSSDSSIRVWDLKEGTLTHVLTGHTAGVGSLAIDDHTVISGGSDQTVRAWDLKTGAQTHLFEGHTGSVTSVAIDGNTVVSGGTDKIVNVWSLETGKLLHKFIGHRFGIHTVAIYGNKVVSGDRTSMWIWNLETGKRLHELKGYSNTLVMNKDVVISGNDGAIQLWDVLTGNLLSTFKMEDPIWYLALDTSVENDIRVAVGTPLTVEVLDFSPDLEARRIAQQGLKPYRYNKVSQFSLSASKTSSFRNIVMNLWDKIRFMVQRWF